MFWKAAFQWLDSWCFCEVSTSWTGCEIERTHFSFHGSNKFYFFLMNSCRKNNDKELYLLLVISLKNNLEFHVLTSWEREQRLSIFSFMHFLSINKSEGPFPIITVFIPSWLCWDFEKSFSKQLWIKKRTFHRFMIFCIIYHFPASVWKMSTWILSDIIDDLFISLFLPWNYTVSLLKFGRPRKKLE